MYRKVDLSKKSDKIKNDIIEDINDDLINLLKQYMAENLLTRAEVAKQLSIDEGTLYYMLSKKNKNLNLDTIIRYAAVTGKYPVITYNNLKK